MTGPSTSLPSWAELKGRTVALNLWIALRSKPIVAKWPVTNVPWKSPSISPLLFPFWFWLFLMASGCDFPSICPNDQSRSRHWAHTFLALAFHTSRGSAGRQLTSSICGDPSWNKKVGRGVSSIWPNIWRSHLHQSRKWCERCPSAIRPHCSQLQGGGSSPPRIYKSHQISVYQIGPGKVSILPGCPASKNECLQRWHVESTKSWHLDSSSLNAEG